MFAFAMLWVVCTAILAVVSFDDMAESEDIREFVSLTWDIEAVTERFAPFVAVPLDASLVDDTVPSATDTILLDVRGMLLTCPPRTWGPMGRILADVSL